MDTIRELDACPICNEGTLSVPTHMERNHKKELVEFYLAHESVAVDAELEKETRLRVQLSEDSATHLWLFQKTLEHLKQSLAHPSDEETVLAAIKWAEQAATNPYQAAAIREEQ